LSELFAALGPSSNRVSQKQLIEKEGSLLVNVDACYFLLKTMQDVQEVLAK
jgi:hypothetical protein